MINSEWTTIDGRELSRDAIYGPDSHATFLAGVRETLRMDAERYRMVRKYMENAWESWDAYRDFRTTLFI